MKAFPGKSKCRILVADERNPDENFTDITLQYEVKEPQVKPKRKIKPWMLVACGVVVIIAGVMIWEPWNNENNGKIIVLIKEDETPPLIGATLNEAFTMTDELEFKLNILAIDGSAGTFGEILQQMPRHKVRFKKGAMMTIFICDGVEGPNTARPFKFSDLNHLKKVIRQLSDTEIKEIMKLAKTDRKIISTSK